MDNTLTSMNKVKQSSTMLGLGSNPGLVLDSYQIKGPDGYVVNNGRYGTSAEIGFMNNNAIRADGPNKKIIQTDWLSAGAIKDVVTFAVSLEISKLTNGTSIPDATTVLEGNIIKRDLVTKQVIKTFDVHYLYRESTCKNPGLYPVVPTGLGMEYFQFTPQHEYKLELKTSREVEPHQSIIIDYIKMEYIDPKAGNYPRSVGISGSSATDIGGTTAITQIEGFDWVASLNGSGDATIRIRPYVYGATSNYFWGVYDYIGGVTVTARESSGADAITVTTTASDTVHGGYDLLIKIDTGFSSGTLYGYGIIQGWKMPKQI